MIILDASVVVKWFSEEEYTEWQRKQNSLSSPPIEGFMNE